MSLYADEIIRFSSVLKMSYNLIYGREELKRWKLRDKKHLISVALIRLKILLWRYIYQE